MTHTGYVIACYSATALVVAALVLWVILDARARRSELKQLEAAGIRRRSAGSQA